MTAPRADYPRHTDLRRLDGLRDDRGVVRLSASLPSASHSVVLSAPGRLVAAPEIALGGETCEAIYLETPLRWLAIARRPQASGWWTAFSASLTPAETGAEPYPVDIRLIQALPLRSCVDQALMPAAGGDRRAASFADATPPDLAAKRINELLDAGKVNEAVAACLSARSNALDDEIMTAVSHRALAAAADDSSLFVTEDTLKLLISLSS